MDWKLLLSAIISEILLIESLIKLLLFNSKFKFLTIE